MLDDHDFAIKADAPTSVEDPAASSAAAPMVLIEYRRGPAAVLAPPILILLAALVIVSYQRQTPFRPIATAPVAAPKVPAGQGRIIMVESSGTGAAFEPINARSETRFGPPAPPVTSTLSPAPAPAQAPSDAEAPKTAGPDVLSPFDLDPPKDSPPAPGRAVVVEPAPAPAPEPAPEPVPPAGPPPVVRNEPEAQEQPRGQNIDDIRREAEQKAAEMKQMEAFKLQARGRMLAEADYKQLYESYQKAHEQRIPFRNDLRLLVETLGSQAGTEISHLCEQYGRSTAPKIREGVVNDLRHASARMTRQAKVEMMRARGLPETVILDFLARELHYQMNTRGGPRDQYEVLVRAAKLLLSFPVTPVKSVAGVEPAAGPGPVRRAQ